MDQSLRDAYLRAMGIDIWLLRTDLSRIPLDLPAGPSTETAPVANTGEAGADSNRVMVAASVSDALAVVLCMVQAPPDLLVLCRPSPGQGALDAVANGLVRDLLLALGGSPRAMQVEYHNWPAPTAKLSAQLAKSVATKLDQMAGRGRVLVMGETASALIPQSWREANVNQRRFAVTHELAALVESPLLKRDLWYHLQPLTHLDAADG